VLDCRAVTFENPEGERGAGGRAAGGRKGAPSRVLAPGERVLLADLRGPGRVRHVWMTFPPAPPEQMRALALEVFYEGAHEPSVSLPCLDLFGLPHGRPAPYHSALLSAQEGRGFNAYLPLPFRERLRVELTNHAARETTVYFQLDYTLEHELPRDVGYLHAGFRRENPTVQRRDFVIHDGLRGPGRFLGCSVGIRVLDPALWYGEGELKVYRDGDREHPTICGTGLEDYVGSAWGMGVHAAPYAGVPLEVREPGGGPQPRFVSFYRWHLADPLTFARECRVTIQQIGMTVFGAEDEAFERYAAAHPPAGGGWQRGRSPGIAVSGICERSDDYCATAYVYCLEPQPVPRLEPAQALADIARLPSEKPHPLEALLR